jgi:hypothetical protein
MNDVDELGLAPIMLIWALAVEAATATTKKEISILLKSIEVVFIFKDLNCNLSLELN